MIVDANSFPLFFLFILFYQESFCLCLRRIYCEFGGNRLIDTGYIKQQVKCGFNALKCNIISCQSHILSQK